MIVSSESLSMPAPSGLKWNGASMWVPVWAPISMRVTLAPSPRAMLRASGSDTPGSFGQTGMPSWIGTVTS